MYDKASSILHCDLQHNIIVLDIPASIQDGQLGGCIVSSAPLERPFVTPEPKGKKREIAISRLQPHDLVYHEEIQACIKTAQDLLAHSFGARQWCLARVNSIAEHAQLLEPTYELRQCRQLLPLVLSNTLNCFTSVLEIQNDLVANSAGITYIECGESFTFMVPAKSNFIWSSVQGGFDVLYNLDPRPVFDFILLDPPWANRSVKHSKAYHTLDRQGEEDAYTAALTIIQHFCSNTGHVATWVTNKMTVRTRVLNAMATLGFRLVEEWIWVKVTCEGVPVTPLDGLWRKPYEILLVFRHGGLQVVPLRRTIFAVPDIHSRKPNLKSLLERTFAPQQVLEIFARNLTSGWWCLGDEVLKYQDVRWWKELPER